MRSPLALLVAALTTAACGVAAAVALPDPTPPLVRAQGAVAPSPLPVADEAAGVVQRKEHARAVAALAEAQAARTAARAARSRRAAAAASADPRSIARALLAAQGQAGQFGCLDRLWTKESEWRVRATNRSSGAYGIPQALPASKMASAGGDWRTNPRTQIRWGLGYISERYGSPCAAWAHSQSHNWY